MKSGRKRGRPCNPKGPTTSFMVTTYRDDIRRLTQLAAIMQVSLSEIIRDCIPSEGLLDIYRRLTQVNTKLTYGAFVEHVIREFVIAGASTTFVHTTSLSALQ